MKHRIANYILRKKISQNEARIIILFIAISSHIRRDDTFEQSNKRIAESTNMKKNEISVNIKKLLKKELILKKQKQGGTPIYEVKDSAFK